MYLSKLQNVFVQIVRMYLRSSTVHLVTKFWTKASGAIWWPNYELIKVAIHLSMLLLVQQDHQRWRYITMDIKNMNGYKMATSKDLNKGIEENKNT